MSDRVENKVYGPYEPVRQAGNLYFVSGQIGVEPTTMKADEGVESQARQALLNLERVLSGVGLGMSDVVKTTVYLTDMADFGTMNNVYVEHFDAPRPARAAIGVNELPRVGGEFAIKVEIEAVAMKGAR